MPHLPRLRNAQALPGRIRETVRRFPLPLLAAAVAFVVVLRHLDGGGALDPLAPAALGIAFFVALRLGGERGTCGRPAEVLLTLAVLGLLAWLHLSWPDWGERLRLVRYGQLFLAGHLLVAALPFLRDGEGFLVTNRLLLFRVLEGLLQALLLFAGVGLALAAVDQLFPVTLSHRAWGRLAAFLLFGFLPLHVLAGMPRVRPKGELRSSAPAEGTAVPEDPALLRVVGRFILVPLAALYLLILTLYLGQLLLARSWPVGWIVWLVGGMATAGILSILLVRPDPATGDGDPEGPAGPDGLSAPAEGHGADRENGLRDPAAPWLRRWERAFWLLMIPASIMLLVAVARRISVFGVTEPRYLAALLGGWLLLTAVLFGATRVRDLRWVPGSLALLLLATAWGPWGAASVSVSSQLGRLHAELDALGLLDRSDPAGPRAIPASPDRTFAPDEGVEVIEVLAWLLDTHREVELAPLLGEAFPLRTEGGRREGAWVARLEAEEVAEALGLDPHGMMASFRRGEPRWVGLAPGAGVPVEGFDRVVPADEGGVLMVAGVRYRVELEAGGPGVALVDPEGGRWVVSLEGVVTGAMRARGEGAAGAGWEGAAPPGTPPPAHRGPPELLPPGAPGFLGPEALSVEVSPPGGEGRVRLVIRSLSWIPGPGGEEARLLGFQGLWLVADGEGA